MNKLKQWLVLEGRSFFNTWASVMVVDGMFELMNVYNGDFSETALIALATASVRSAVKALLQMLLPIKNIPQTVGTDSKVPVVVSKSTSVKRK